MVGDRVPLTVDFSWVAANKWRKNASFAATARVRTEHGGFEFEAITGGQSGNKEPIWPRNVDDTVDDGSIVWQAKAISTDSLLKVLASVSWDAPAGLTVSGDVMDATTQLARAYVEKTASGTLDLEVWATFNDTPATVEGFIFRITDADES